MAGTQHKSSAQTLFRIRWNHKGPHETPMTRSTINKNQARRRARSTNSWDTPQTKKDARCVHQNPQCKRDDAHRPTRQISRNIKQRKSIYYGVSGSQWKLHWHRANEKQVSRIDGKVLPSIMETIDSHWRYSTRNTFPWQWSIWGFENGNQKELYNPTGAPQQPQT